MTKLAMLDLETLGNKHDAVIVSAAIVAFDTNVPLTVTSELEFCGSTKFYYAIVDITEQANRRIDASTVKWWMNQSVEAKDIFSRNDPYRVVDFMLNLISWYKSEKPEGCYAYPSTFDHVILQDLFDQHGVKNPIHYREQLCMRTLVKFFNIECPELPDWLVPHNALHDCVRQILWIQEIFRKQEMLLGFVSG